MLLLVTTVTTSSNPDLIIARLGRVPSSRSHRRASGALLDAPVDHGGPRWTPGFPPWGLRWKAIGWWGKPPFKWEKWEVNPLDYMGVPIFLTTNPIWFGFQVTTALVIITVVAEVQSAEFLSYDRFCLYTCKSLGCKVKDGERPNDLEFCFFPAWGFPFCTGSQHQGPCCVTRSNRRWTVHIWTTRKSRVWAQQIWAMRCSRKESITGYAVRDDLTLPKKSLIWRMIHDDLPNEYDHNYTYSLAGPTAWDYGKHFHKLVITNCYFASSLPLKLSCSFIFPQFFPCFPRPIGFCKPRGTTRRALPPTARKSSTRNG